MSYVNSKLDCLGKIEADSLYRAGWEMDRLLSPVPIHKERGLTMIEIKERRAWVRYKCALPSLCKSAGEPSPTGWAATILNVSAGGICLRLAEKFAPGNLLLIEIADHKRLTLQVRVLHVRELGGDFFEIGCRFLRELDEDELRRLLL